MDHDAMSERARRTLLRLLDRMDDHYDLKLTDTELRDQARWCRAILDAEPPTDDADVAAAAVALDEFLAASVHGRCPQDTYSDLRLALAELEPPERD
jgi:hypothetical protein